MLVELKRKKKYKTDHKKIKRFRIDFEGGLIIEFEDSTHTYLSPDNMLNIVNTLFELVYKEE